MFRKKISFLILLVFCFSNLSVDSYLHWNEVGKNSREFVFFKSVQSADLGEDSEATEVSKKADKTEAKGSKKEFKVEKYSDAYKKAVEDIYDQFEKAYRRNQEIINRSSGLINQTGYQRLLNKQVESENLFKKAFKAAKITKNGDELVFPEFKFEEVNKAVVQLQEWIIKKNETYIEEKTKLDEKISACVASEPLVSRLTSEKNVKEDLDKIKTIVLNSETTKEDQEKRIDKVIETRAESDKKALEEKIKSDSKQIETLKNNLKDAEKKLSYWEIYKNFIYINWIASHSLAMTQIVLVS